MEAANAVVISGEDGRVNTRGPGGGLPWSHVGTRDAYSAVYLGNRWVLTAAHVGAFPVRFAGREYRPLPGSPQRILNRDGSPSDLVAFRVEGPPPLPLMPLAGRSPAPGQRAWLVGQGHDRGRPTTWTDSDRNTHTGFEGTATRSMRWGTNQIETAASDVSMNGIETRALMTTFSPPGDPSATRFEAQVAVGDSGGALFVFQRGHFSLAGILILRSQEPGQPHALTLFGNRTFAADIAHYREQLIALTRPDCSDELDNDDDGEIDFPDDAGCASVSDNSEAGRRSATPR